MAQMESAEDALLEARTHIEGAHYARSQVRGIGRSEVDALTEAVLAVMDAIRDVNARLRKAGM